MRARALALVWLVIGVAVWCGFFDLYVSRGARLYLEEHAEYELHLLREEPSINVVMGRAKRDGVIAASLWATGIVCAGWATIWLHGGKRSRSSSSSSRGSL
jgi:hypothetical protein